MPTPAEIAPIVQECFNRRDAAALLALWTDDFHYQGPNVEFVGKERMLAQEQNLWQAFSDIRCEVLTFVAGSDRATLVTTMVGTNDGPLPTWLDHDCGDGSKGRVYVIGPHELS